MVSIKVLEFCLTWDRNEMTIHPPRVRERRNYTSKVLSTVPRSYT